MDIFEHIKSNGLEQLLFCSDESVGLRAIVAIHNTLLGPALGTVRMMEYPDQNAAVADAVNRAREMTYRASIADCDLGGASAVLWGNPTTDKSEAYFRALGRFIERLSGQLYVVMGVGTDSTDVHHIRRETDRVLSLPEEFGGLADATKVSADSIMQGLKAVSRDLGSKSSLAGLSFLVQGLGRIGYALVERLAADGATLIVTDLNYDRIKGAQDRWPDVTMVRPDDAFDVRCDVIVPCTPFNVVTAEMAKRLKCRAVAGASAFIAPDPTIADDLHERGILYVPNFAIDCGEVIQADYDRKHLPVNRLTEAIEGVYRRTRRLLEEAKAKNETPLRTAVRNAQQRLTSIGNIGRRNAW